MKPRVPQRGAGGNKATHSLNSVWLIFLFNHKTHSTRAHPERDKPGFPFEIQVELSNGADLKLDATKLVFDHARIVPGGQSPAVQFYYYPNRERGFRASDYAMDYMQNYAGFIVSLMVAIRHARIRARV